MKKIFTLVAACVLTGASSFAASRYWIGTSNGNWNNSTNWSAEADGTPGASVPGINDDVFFSTDVTVQIDNAPAVHSLEVAMSKSVIFYTNTPTSITISGSLRLAPGSSLKDSTTAPMAFPVILTGTATAEIYGYWIFTSNNPSNVESTEGPSFLAPTGTKVTVRGQAFSSGEGRLISRHNAGIIQSTPATLEFVAGSYYVIESDLEASIPAATWNAASTLSIKGNVSTIVHQGVRPSYGVVSVDLSTLSADASLDLPAGTVVKGLFSVLNTNSKTLSLLTAGSGTTPVETVIRNSMQITGATSEVALATATPVSAESDFTLAVTMDFVQTGGNFSLQNANNASGVSSLIIGRNMRQTAGTFVTRSTSTAAKFVLDMDYNHGGDFKFDAEQTMRMTSGSIDNAQHMVTLKLNSKTEYTGVTLQSPLTVGKVEFIGGPVTTTAINILTIANTNASAAVTVGQRNSYVNGPVRIMTASTEMYILPTGKNTVRMARAYLRPQSAVASVYQAEFYRNGYSDLTNITKPLSGVATDKYWNIEKIAGADASVRLTLGDNVEGATANDGYVVAHYTDGKWITEQGQYLMPGNLMDSTVTSRPLTSYSAFTIGYYNVAAGALPVKIVRFEAAKVGKTANIEWKAEEIPVRFDLQRSADGKNFSTIASVTGVSNRQQYNYTDASLPQGTVYYRLYSVEKDGSGSYSRIAAIVSQDNRLTITAMAPTFVSSQAKLMISAAGASRLNLVVTDMMGRSVKQMQVSVPAGSSETTLELSSLRSGIYQIGAMVNGLPVSVIRFQKN